MKEQKTKKLLEFRADLNQKNLFWEIYDSRVFVFFKFPEYQNLAEKATHASVQMSTIYLYKEFSSYVEVKPKKEISYMTSIL